jgi:hypothetical protein
MLVMGQLVSWQIGMVAALLFALLVWANDRTQAH